MTTTEGQCAVCSKPGKLCASCENIHYCGRDCQKADWAVHKLLCRSFKNARDPPGPNMMRVIVFPFNSTKIEFRWMPINRRKVHRPNSGHFFGTDNQWKKNSPALTDFRSFVQDPKTGKRLRHRITIQFRDEYQTDGSIPNIAINNLVGGSSLLKFAGPIIAYGNVDVKQGTETQSINLDTSDLKIIKDWFTYGFFKCKNEQFYRDRLEGRGNVLNVDETKECIDTWEKEQRAMGKPVREFTAEEAGSPE
ncbi:hypothetical protein KCU81_g1745, partial [Aureobasidium melanogenum]|uniref:MYND-type domain-containing protein n=1 Tax=Aureobasidium melanogenum (strain CBS 110374) TaxID=1043003 RepID=A0A074VTU8_AURM1